LSNKWRIPFLQTTLTNRDLIFGKLPTCQNNNIPVIDKSYRLNPANATGSPLQSNFYFADSVSWMSSVITTTITLEAWVKPNSFTFAGNDSGLGTIMIANSNFYLSLDGNGKFNAYVQGSGGGFVSHQPSTTSVTRHAWNHVVVTFDGAYIRWYLNGVLDKTSSTTFTIGTITLTNYLGIGSEGAATYGRMLDGYVAGCKIYGKALTTTEVSQNYESSKTEFSNLPNVISSNLILYLDADVYSSYPNTGTIWYDLSDSAKNFTTYANQTVTALSFTSTEPRYFTFNGTSNFASSNGINLGTSVTVSVWIKMTSTAQCGILGDCLQNRSFTGYDISNGKMRYWYEYNYPSTQTVTGTTSVNTGTWKHLTWVKTGTSLIMYIDGVQDFSATLLTNVTGFVNSVGTLWGPCNASPFYTSLFNGQMANIMCYSVALSSAQVLQNYNAQKYRFGK